MFVRDEQHSSYRPLSAIVPEGIDWVPSVSLAAAMSVTTRQLRSDVRVLKQLELVQLYEVERELNLSEMFPGVNEIKRKRAYRCRRKGFDRSDAEIIWLFRQAVKERGRPLAITSIYKIVENFYDYQRRTRSNQSG